MTPRPQPDITQNTTLPGWVNDPVNPWVNDAVNRHRGSRYVRNHYNRYGPYWFGKNSTRGVLSDAIADMMKDAAYPTAQLMPLKWQLGSRGYNHTSGGNAVAEYNWKLDEYIRTTVARRPEDTKQVHFSGQDPLKMKMTEGFHKHYIAPQISWEFVHPKLPVVRVTAQNSKVLPLTLPGTQDPGPTEYSVSFVIAFQNRWESLDDPNRWVTRFKETLRGDGILDIPRNNPEIEKSYQEIPGEWHYTDFMQHSIIGPVVLQVHKSPVLEPGTYSTIPNVTKWEAPGHIATDQQILKPRRIPEGPTRGGIMDRQSELAPYFDDQPSSDSPNANLPLPGHVITDAATGPGTEIWDNYDMNANEW